MMCEEHVTEAMIDAGLDELESCLPWPYSWESVRARIREAYLAMDRLRGVSVPREVQPEVGVERLSPW